MENIGEIGGLVGGFVLTLFVYSYIVKDNPMYRLAVHILVGVSSGFAAVILVNKVLLPVIDNISSQGDILPIVLWAVPIILAVLLLSKLIPRLAWIGSSSMAVLISVGAAVGLVGAIMGTLIPQVIARQESGWLTIVVAVLTICVLAYFHFTGKLTNETGTQMPQWFGYVTLTGKVVMTIALAGVFAGFFSTTIVLLIERMGFFFDSFRTLITG